MVANVADFVGVLKVSPAQVIFLPPPGVLTMSERITDFARRYCMRVGGSPGYLEQLTVLTKRLPWIAADLTPDKIDAYLTDALAHLAPSTVDNHRRMLRSLMRFAAAEGLVDRSIVRPLRRVKLPRPDPRAWSHDDIRRLLAAADRMQGRTLHCQLKILLPAWILTAYATGLRLTDLLSLRHDALRGCRMSIPQSKTRYATIVMLDENALRAIACLPRVGPRIFGSLVGRSRMIVAMRGLVKSAGLCGSSKYLRRSGATYCEIAGKDSTGHLGHRSPGMKIYYVDRLLLAEERNDQPAPPSINLEAACR
jgi:integrase